MDIFDEVDRILDEMEKVLILPSHVTGGQIKGWRKAAEIAGYPRRCILCGGPLDATTISKYPEMYGICLWCE
jgi:hypothetical protein